MSKGLTCGASKVSAHLRHLQRLAAFGRIQSDRARVRRRKRLGEGKTAARRLGTVMGSLRYDAPLPLDSILTRTRALHWREDGTSCSRPAVLRPGEDCKLPKTSADRPRHLSNALPQSAYGAPPLSQEPKEGAAQKEWVRATPKDEARKRQVLK